MVEQLLQWFFALLFLLLSFFDKQMQLAGFFCERSISLSEDFVNTYITPQVVDATGLQSIYIDLIPGGINFTTRIATQAGTVSVTATSILTVDDEGYILAYLTGSSVGGFPSPAPVQDILNNTVIPSINTELNRAVRLDPCRIAALTITNTDMLVQLSCCAEPSQ
jgi:hypothetical protein